ncbi:YeeE/YedE family protein [Alicyclobacillus vulcanalis]|uniref:Uncharacterized protein n=1 Tax=Alicyclobacillus vulcanalis TaxID=252246 RepID=A0A1N7PCE6_9BACL|nr:YeeE/YedE family protein [Alicyclobacillus vulcanalis]SIT08264.1 hypothetical protein SAMN05421799_11295 [Alicyclobacillus vulcanalis]
MASPEARIVDLEARTMQSPSDHVQRVWTAAALIVFVLGFFYLWNAVSPVHAVLFLVTGVLGVALYYAHFGFTTSFRTTIVSGRTVGLRAQMIMFALANVLFLPLLVRGHVFDHAVKASVYPVGLSVLVGSFLFGIGMQLGDGCASGTLYHTGGGDARGLLTLVGFVIGSFFGSLNYAWWMSTPSLGKISLIQSLGPLGGIAANFAIMALIFVGSLWLERRRNGDVEPLVTRRAWHVSRIVKGPWSWIAGGVVLAVGNFIVLALSGKPWGITSAFALWAAKLSAAFGYPVQSLPYWQTPQNAAALHHSVLQNLETTDDIAIMLGALLAASLAGALPKRYLRPLPWQMIVGVLLGGCLMGYGARIAFGCNIGAYFSGVASFSLHGWEWFAGALIGSLIGVRLRPACRLPNR